MNLFIRTSIAPYRIDIYNALHERLDMKMCFYYRTGSSQAFDADSLERKCAFKPVYLDGIRLGSDNRKLCFGIWRLLRREKPALVIVPEFQIVLLQVLFYRWITRGKFKVVSMIDDSFDMISNDNDFTRLHARLRTVLPKYLDDLIVVTPEVREWYRQRFGKGVWMPIIMNEQKARAYYGSLLPRSAELAAEYGLEGRKVLLAVNRLVALKNLYRVIEAFNMAETDSVLVIVGDGPERGNLEAAASRCGKRIIFTGRLEGDDLYAWYNISGALILASWQEAFGAVTNEALLAGCRVIVSRNAGSSCLVNDDNGEIVDPMDVRGMARAVDRQLAVSGIRDLSVPRKNLMSVSFEERISNLVVELTQ